MKAYAQNQYRSHSSSKWEQWIFEQRKLLMNKLCALVLIGIGALPVFIEKDATVLVLFLFFAIPMFFSKENWFI